MRWWFKRPKRLTKEEAYARWEEAWKDVKPPLTDDELKNMCGEDLHLHMKGRTAEGKIYCSCVSPEDYQRLFVRRSRYAISVDPKASALSHRVSILSMGEWFRFYRVRGLYPTMDI